MEISNQPVQYTTSRFENPPSDIYDLHDNERLVFIYNKNHFDIEDGKLLEILFSSEEVEKMMLIEEEDLDVDIANLILTAASENNTVFYVKSVLENGQILAEMLEHATPNIVILKDN